MTIAFALALAGAQIAQTGLTPPADRENGASRRDEGFQAQADRLRVMIILNPEAAAGLLPAADRLAIEAAVGRIDAVSAMGLSWFFRTSVTRVVRAGPTRRAIYVNPIIDAVLDLDFEQVGGVWHVIGARVADGAAWRDPRLSGRWTATAGPRRQAFATRFQATIERVALPVAGSIDTTEFARRIADTFRGLSGLGRDPAATRGAATLVTSLKARGGKPAGGAAMGADQAVFAALPRAVLRSLVPVAAYHGTGDWTILVASPLRPDLILFADLDTDGHMTGVVPVDLADPARGDVS